MTPCVLHGGISTTLCGCGETPEMAQKPDVHRYFSELPLGQRVRFAGRLREVELCGQCRLPAVLIQTRHLRITRRAWVHDAVVGPAGYIAGALCTEYVYPTTRKRSKKNGKD